MPNVAWRTYNLRELAAVRDLQPAVLLVPLYSADNPATLLKREQLAKLLADLPGCRVLYRSMADAIPTYDPRTWAAECAARYKLYRGVAEGGLIGWNEDNLAVEHGDENWPARVIWRKTFLAEMSRLLPGVERHLGALSPSGNWRTGLGAMADDRALMALVDVVDVHAYGPDARMILEDAAAFFPNKTLSVTEFNDLKASIFLEQVPSRVREAIWFLCGGTSDQSQYDIIGSPYYQDFKETARQTVSTYSSPNHEGPRAHTLGVVLHSTRGSSASPQTEYDGTVSWFDTPASQVSAHAIVGPKGQLHLSVDPDLIAWHCRARNAAWLGIELVQSHRGDAIAGDVLDGAARVVADWHRRYRFPLAWSLDTGICEHWETPEGKADGKTDIQAPFDRADFLARIKKLVTPPLNVGELTEFPRWALARLQHQPEPQDFRGSAGLTAFKAHLKALGADAATPGRYGWPG